MIRYSRVVRSIGCAVALLSACAASAAEEVVPQPGTMAARMMACTACHGAQGRSGPDGYYPRIAGKPAEYLYNQLRHFREGRRQYQPMRLLLENMSDDYLREIAAWFAAQHPPYPRPDAAGRATAALESGRRLVFDGDPARGIPACAACHGAALTGMLPAVPGLVGLPYDYLNAQFGAWRTGLRHATEPDCMADVAQRLRPDEIGAVAAWLSTQPVPSAAPEAARPLPVACGSQGARP